CYINKKSKIYIHEKAFEKTFGIENGKLDEEPCSIRWTEEQHEKIKGRLILTKNETWLTDDIVISGTIPAIDGYHPTEFFYIKESDGSLKPDLMEHEQFLAIRVRNNNGRSKGIFVLSGCSHNGVIPCLRYAKSLFPEERILGFLAGMHLYNSNKEIRNDILGQVAAEEMDFVLPVHCTGIHAICELKLLMGDRCIPAGAGDRFIF
ncbi:MAG: MBL fold metallo-hydrolase, partial [Bacillota bacterium]